MANLKDYREQRNAAIKAAKDIEAKAKDEKRDLDNDELDKVNNSYAEATRSDKLITALEQKRALETKLDEEGKKPSEERDAKQESRAKQERRALETYLKTQSTKELRDIDPTLSQNNGSALIPKSVDAEIIKKLGESAPVVQNSRLFPTTTGSLTVARETNPEEAGFVGEAQDTSKINESFDSVTLNGTRVGAFAQLTEEMTTNSAANLVDYTTSRLSDSLAKTLERSILVGKGSKSSATAAGFRPVVGGKGVQNVTVSKNVTTEDMLDLYGKLNPSYYDGAMFVVSRNVYDQIIKLKDGDGSYLIFRGIVDGKPGATFQGIPVHVSDTLDGADSEIVFGNFNAGYGLMQKQGITLSHVTGDTQQVISGGHLIVIAGMFDGDIINPDALVTAKLGK